MSVGKTIKEIRKQRNLTQKQLADQIEISRSYLSDIENGNKNPSIKTTQRLAEKLGVTVAYLTSGKKMYADLTDEEKTQQFIKLNKMLRHEYTSKEEKLKNELLELLERKLSFNEIHYLNNALIFLKEDERDNILFMSVLIQQLYNYKGSKNKAVYDDMISEFSEFLYKYFNIKQGD